MKILFATAALAILAPFTPSQAAFSPQPVLQVETPVVAPGSLTIQEARRGADDPAGDDHGRRGGKGRKGGRDDGPNHASADTGFRVIQEARRGADDPAGDDHGRRGGKGRKGGRDDGPNHASADTGSRLIQEASRGRKGRHDHGPYHG